MSEDSGIQTGHEHFRIDNRQQASAASLELIGKARREINILVHDYDDVMLPPMQFTGLLSEFITQHQQNRVRYLCSESSRLHERGARLVELARRFSTFIKLRQIPDDLKPVTEQCLLIDDIGSLHQQDYNLASYYVSVDDRVRNRRHSRHFDDLWQRAGSVPGIHVTGLPG